MRRGRINCPIVTVNNADWACLATFAERHEFCAEVFREKNEQFSFADGHRVRVYSAKKNVHWKLPQGINMDISEVPVAGQSPPRKLPRT